MTRKQPATAFCMDQRQGPELVAPKTNIPKRTRITPQIAKLILQELDGGRSVEQTAKAYQVREIQCLEILAVATRRDLKRAA